MGMGMGNFLWGRGGDGEYFMGTNGDGENFMGMGRGWGQFYLPCHSLMGTPSDGQISNPNLFSKTSNL